MALPTTATVDYTITPVPPVTQAQLNTAVTAVALPTSSLANFGATLASDVTSNVGGDVRRRVVFNLTAGFFKNFSFDHTSPPANSYFSAMFKNIFTHVLGAEIGGLVVAAAPVLA